MRMSEQLDWHTDDTEGWDDRMWERYWEEMSYPMFVAGWYELLPEEKTQDKETDG